MLVLLLDALARDPVAAEPTRSIYRCRSHGVTILADRPCDDSATPQNLAVHTPAIAAGPKTPQPATRPTPPRRAADAGPQAAPEAAARSRESRCAELRERLAAHAQRMRAGYRAREAGALWERERALKQERRDAGC